MEVRPLIKDKAFNLIHPSTASFEPAERTQSVHPGYSFFLAIEVLSRVFRVKFIAGLNRAFL